MNARAQDAVDAIAAQWHKELPALAAENMILIGRLKRCAVQIDRELERVFAAHGLGGGLFDVLATLRRSGAPYTLTPTELYSSLMVSSGTISTRLKKLEAEGWIERLPNPEDARSLLVRLTAGGKERISPAASMRRTDAAPPASARLRQTRTFSPSRTQTFTRPRTARRSGHSLTRATSTGRGPSRNSASSSAR